MAETIFTGEEIEKFASRKCVSAFKTLNAIFSGFFKDFLMRNRPCNTRSRNS